ncbi:aldose 1-epimerase family protein [Paenibacillus sp. BSR1-1]|uniref:aldose 1-epimerase family protein n=1 Tax=Paenibacillus sp. BSR1-1 TaxID=3020845 RepID=UPI0025B07155|nr:aldose 1-epimerase family protein [Paenibacillus sp. BSR1-1]MDN3016141.1 aldose 1-epimerase family protein [Paenibacillus sp. BSR1-1]
MIIIENDWLQVDMARNGAEVRKVKHKKNGLDYMWTGDSAYWGRVSPVLFPIVGRLKEDHYHLNGQTYKMSQHGFLRDVEFNVETQTTTTVSFVFESAGRFVEIYPYEFKAIIRYLLKEDSLSVQWEIANENREEMFFSIGAHPAFRLPLVENEVIEDYSLHFTPAANKNVMEYELKNSLLHEKGTANDISSMQLKASIFAHDALVYSNINQISLISNRSNHGVEVMFVDFPFVGIWSKFNETDGTMAPFVCIEPWYGIADTHHTTGNLKEKFGINKLHTGETFKAEYKMKFT